jgi:anti-sigma factor ChrR (cupin superfamily)
MNSNTAETRENDPFTAPTPQMVWAWQHLSASAEPASLPEEVEQSLKQSIMQRIRAEQTARTQATQAQSAQSTYTPALAAVGAGDTGFSYQHDDGTGWFPHEHEGIWVKPLSVDKERGYAITLMKMQPHAVYPDHHHLGSEQCYVLAGTVSIHGRQLQAGDFHNAAAGTDHGDISTDTGNMLLLVVSLPDYKQTYRGMTAHFLKEFIKHPLRTLRRLQAA